MWLLSHQSGQAIRQNDDLGCFLPGGGRVPAGLDEVHMESL